MSDLYAPPWKSWAPEVIDGDLSEPIRTRKQLKQAISSTLPFLWKAFRYHPKEVPVPYLVCMQDSLDENIYPIVEGAIMEFDFYTGHLKYNDGSVPKRQRSQKSLLEKALDHRPFAVPIDPLVVAHEGVHLLRQEVIQQGMNLHSMIAEEFLARLGRRLAAEHNKRELQPETMESVIRKYRHLMAVYERELKPKIDAGEPWRIEDFDLDSLVLSTCLFYSFLAHYPSYVAADNYFDRRGDIQLLQVPPQEIYESFSSKTFVTVANEILGRSSKEVVETFDSLLKEDSGNNSAYLIFPVIGGQDEENRI